MTIINISRKFIFIHIPKTAGTSTRVFFRQFANNCDIEIGGPHRDSMLAQQFAQEVRLAKHSRARDVQNILGHDTYRQYFRFSIVRDPFARTVSAFKFLKSNFREWDEANVMGRFSTVEQFVLSDFFQQPGPDRMLEPQMEWLLDDAGNQLVDFIGRMETLDADVKTIAQKLELSEPASDVEKKNVSKRDGSIESEYALTPLVQEIIRERYRQDFELLNYPVIPADELLGVGNWVVEPVDS